MADRILKVEVCDDNKVFISEEHTSGSVYDGHTPDDVGYAVTCYLEDNPE